MADEKLARVSSTNADAQLAKMGYKSELPRHLSMISVMGLSFAIMAVPYGFSTTLAYSLLNGQAVTVLWGWVTVSLITCAIAASLAEICSVYPTAGGVYYWSAMLSTPKYRAVTSWITGWLTLVGNWTVTVAINFGGAQLILSAITLWKEDYVPNAWQTVLMYFAVMIVCALVNIFFSRYLDQINKLCVAWTAASVIVILVTLLVTADNRRSAKWVFTHFETTSGWPAAWSFFIGLLQGAYVLTGYGMVAAMCEEVQNPHIEVPKGIFLSVVFAGLTGIVYLLSLLFVLPDIAGLLEIPSGQPIATIFKVTTGSAGGGFGLLFLILGIWFFAGVGALTAASRCTYAFARDGAIPGSRFWSQVNRRLEVPLNGIILSTIVCCLLGLIYFGSVAAFNSFTGVATICLGSSYGVPILVNLLTGRKAVKNAPFTLGRFGTVINAVTVLWFVFALVLFSMPMSVPVEATTMNYTSVVFAGFTVISAAWFFIRGRKSFTGPPIVSDSSSDDAVEDVGMTRQAAAKDDEEKVKL